MVAAIKITTYLSSSDTADNSAAAHIEREVSVACKDDGQL